MKRILLLCVLAAAAAANPFVHEFPATGPLTLILKDRLDHPFYWWPRTLLNYRVHFGAARIRSNELVLTQDGKAVPIQLSETHLRDGYLESAVVSFFADLPAGGERRFELARGTASVASAGVSEQRTAEGIVLDTGALRVRLATAAGTGPIRQFWRDGRWIGDSHIISPGRTVTSFQATREENGPMFITYKLAYTFSGGATYTARVKAVAGYDFVGLDEEMTGFAPSDAARVEFTWTGFHATHRQAPNHPYQQPNPTPGYDRYNWERIDEGNVVTQHGVSTGIGNDGEFSFRLGPYQPWGAYVMLTSANFWDQQRGDAVGIFIDHAERWQDHEYAIWASSNTLQVRYYYRNGVLSWRAPLATGTRSTGIAVYDHAEDIRAMVKLDAMAAKPAKYRDGLSYRALLSPMSHTMFLQNRYGTIDLDLVKDWILEYSANAQQAPMIFPSGPIASLDELWRRVFTGFELVRDLPVQGTRQNAGFAPVPSRSIYDWFVDAFDRNLPRMTQAQRERLTAVALMLAYTHADEDYMPMKTMLSGHPNFLSDVKSAPADFAFLFPQHPMAHEWADEFEKFLDLNTRYHTRPAVAAWDSHGGRWTENLGTYVWGFLRPALRANYVLSHNFDGKNRFAIPQMSAIGEWLVNALSAPFDGENGELPRLPDGRIDSHDWGRVTHENGPRRIHAPQGAHSARRMPPRSMWLLGTMLRNFDPLVAEHLMWAAHPQDDDMEEPANTPWRIMFNQPDNRGTNPHLESSKYTGYGVVLRAGVDTPQELSVHLQQIDEGPNYRWGIAGEGGCGVIYFYAGGKSYSHNGREDVGDRQTHDTDLSSNFGVWKNGMFRSIGRNGLEKPLANLGFAQYAEITPRQGPNAYSWPEYQGRSILLAGTDYFVVYDHVYADSVAHRFSWFTQAQDEMPVIRIVKGNPRDVAGNTTQITTSATKGVWYDGMGDSMAVITHRRNLQIDAAKFGARVSGEGWKDLVFRNSSPIQLQEGDTTFDGRSGLVRQTSAGETTLSIFDGVKIASRGVSVEPEVGVAVSAAFRDGAEVGGRFTSLKGGMLTVASAHTPAAASFYIDGVKADATVANGVWKVKLPAGKHAWELTAGPAQPPAARILQTVNRSGEADVYFAAAGGATEYRAQMSRDNGATWSAAGTAAASPIHLTGLKNGEKVHVRLIAANASKSSAPGLEYPIYVTADAPPFPDGLHLQLAKDQVGVDWGEVLGASEYRLYRRVVGEANYTMIYHGPARSFRDHAPGVVPAYDNPGMRADAARPPATVKVYEYVVSAVNGNGEGARSPATDTSPSSWRNWDPKPGEPFRRRFTYNTTNYSQVGQEEPTPRYYPKN